ncbi:MAG: FAH family protein [Pseudomonadota bacterium]|nr:FAH family protein [Pseudomonadota bacterium]
MRLIQFLDMQGQPHVGKIDASGTRVEVLAGATSVYELAMRCFHERAALDTLAGALAVEGEEPYEVLRQSGRMLPPLTHPEPHRCLVSGTGLTHLGSASARDAMHRKATSAATSKTPATDSARMFQWGIEGGRPEGQEPGVQPEWFYKGNGSIVVGCGSPITAPSFALDCGEEPELVGLYVISPRGVPARLGYAIGNEFSDHVTERRNYLYLAHSKLRQCAVGPELRTGPLPRHLEGRSRIFSGDRVRWEKPFLTGEDNMSHSLANLEYHHFKYVAHRIPGDVHLHFFGTATLSFADGIRVEPGERYEIELAPLGSPLMNTLAVAPPDFEMGGTVAL